MSSKLDTEKYFKNKNKVADALLDCIKQDDIDGFKDILKAYLDFNNKEAFYKRVGISRRTLYRMLEPEGNPSLENVAKLISKLAA